MGLSEKLDGAIEVASIKPNEVKNLEKFLKKQGIGKNYLRPVQSHSNKAVKASTVKRINADAIVTNKNDLALTVTVADCFPVYFFDPTKNIIALAHSGWRGTVFKSAQKTIKAMGSNPKIF